MYGWGSAGLVSDRTWQANTSQPLTPFVPGRGLIGSIHVGGLLRFGPQGSVNLRLVQNVYGIEDGLVLDGGSIRLRPDFGYEDLQDNMVTHVLTRSVHVQRSSELPSEPAGEIHRTDTQRRAGSLLAIHFVCGVPAG